MSTRYSLLLLLAATIVLPISTLAMDSDADGLDDSVETNTGTFVSPADTGSDPANADTDGDDANDGFEVSFGTNPNILTDSPLQQKRINFNGAMTELFGISVAVDGEWAAAGSLLGNSGTGSVNIFRRVSGVWTQHAILTASDAGVLDNFGVSLALQGDTLIVGADGGDRPGLSGTGAAYVFTESGTVWSEQQKLTSSSTSAGDRFAYQVAIDGDSLVLGAFESDESGSNSGSAYVFTRTAGTWSEQQKLTAADAQAEDQFGLVVDISADTVIVGAYLEDTAGSDAGAAYIFTRVGSSWSQQQKIAGFDTAAGDEFGIGVAVEGDTALVGARKHDGAGGDTGAFYVFGRSANVWTQSQKILASDRKVDDEFGAAVTLHGDLALVSTLDPHPTHPTGFTEDGRVYIFQRNAGLWSELDILRAIDQQNGDSFGFGVDIDNQTAMVGALAEDQLATDAGAIYLFNHDLDLDRLPDIGETNTGSFNTPLDSGTDPGNPDSDGDGLLDGEEVAIFLTDPNTADQDSDGLNDREELSGTMFVTASTQDGNLGGLAGADALCTLRAKAAGLPGDYVAWLSTDTVDAIDRVEDRPYRRTDGQWIANSRVDLTDGDLAESPNLSANQILVEDQVWTGTQVNGRADSSGDCSDWTSAASGVQAMTGLSEASSSNWIVEAPSDCSTQRHLYCFGGIATDPANPDTDGDGVSDGDEVASGTLPFIADLEIPMLAGWLPWLLAGGLLFVKMCRSSARRC